MGADHPVTWCKDYKGGRSFYTASGRRCGRVQRQPDEAARRARSPGPRVAADPVYSDCGATVLANYEQTKISAPPNLLEPIGFDQLPDGRIIQTARTGTVRLHNPATGTTQVLANFGDASLPTTMRLYTNSEDGLYGPAIDNNFATNKWVYLYYSPQTVVDVKLSDGSVVTQTTPTTNAAEHRAVEDRVGPVGRLLPAVAVQVRRGRPRRRALDLSSEQQIMRVSNNRQECCHVAGDIDFDKHNNLWLVTGDDSPAGGVNGGGFGLFNDQLTDEQQTVRVTNATGGTFTLTFNGQTTAPLAVQLDRGADRRGARGAQQHGRQRRSGGRRAGEHGQRHRDLPARAGAVQPAAADQRGVRPDRRDHGDRSRTTRTVSGGWYQRPSGDDRRSTLNTNDRRGKLLRIKVKDGDITAAEANKADFGTGPGAYTIPAGNMFPLVGGAPQPKTDPAIHSMGFRNPFRLQVDENDVAYISDYSPDANTPRAAAAPQASAASRSFASRRTTATRCATRASSATTSGSRFATHHDHRRIPLNDPPQPMRLRRLDVINDSRWNLEGGPGNETGLRELPPVADPIIWYSYNDNRRRQPAGDAVLRLLRDDPRPHRAWVLAPSARGCSPSCTPAAWARTASPSTTTTRPTRTR